jgi:sarcosine oxidase subunit alpha
VEAQNVLGAVSTDALGVIDFLFPRGLDHHEMFAGVPVIEKAVAGVARHLAGLGQLPEKTAAKNLTAQSRIVDLVVVGAGPAGLALAKTAVDAGLQVELVDESASPGGRLECGLGGAEDLAWAQRAADTIAKRGRLSLNTLAMAAYRDSRGSFLALRDRDPERVTTLYAKRFALCTGGSETLPLFEGNDLPGVFGARGLLKMIQRHGVVPGKRAVILAEHFEGLAVAEALARAGMEIAAVVDPSGKLSHATLPVLAGNMAKAAGRNDVSKVKVALLAGGNKSFSADVVAVSHPPAPAFELVRQLGVRVDFTPHLGFTMKHAADGSTAMPHVVVAGELTGSSTISECIAQGEAAARALAVEVAP